MKFLIKEDAQIATLIKKEQKRQREGLEMIPSENYASPAVLEALGSDLNNKYSEGYPKRRYYGGNEFIDEIEILTQERAKKLFGVEYANVQPYSGSPANFAVYTAILKPGDKIMGLSLTSGGHLTHGAARTASSIYFRSVQYEVESDGTFDFKKIRALAKKEKPQVIVAGFTAVPLIIDWKKFSDIAKEVGAYFFTDISHITGLIIAGAHPSPVPYADIIMTTSHKTLRGPRGAMILVTKKGLVKDPELPKKIDSAVFPGLQGGPHDHQTAAIAVALHEAAKPEFRVYGKQIVKNAKALAAALEKNGLKLVADGTENHLILIDLTPLFGPGGGFFVEKALDAAGITTNKNTIPKEPSSPFYPSGIRLGTPVLTTRGMKEKEMDKIAAWIGSAIRVVSNYRLPPTKEERKPYLQKFREDVKKNQELKKINKEVQKFASSFEIFAW